MESSASVSVRRRAPTGPFSFLPNTPVRRDFASMATWVSASTQPFFRP